MGGGEPELRRAVHRLPVCLHALQAGKRNVVVDVDTHHHTRVGWKSPEIEARFVESERMFREKWAGKFPGAAS